MKARAYRRAVSAALVAIIGVALWRERPLEGASGAITKDVDVGPIYGAVGQTANERAPAIIEAHIAKTPELRGWEWTGDWWSEGGTSYARLRKKRSRRRSLVGVLSAPQNLPPAPSVEELPLGTYLKHGDAVEVVVVREVVGEGEKTARMIAVDADAVAVGASGARRDLAYTAAKRYEANGAVVWVLASDGTVVMSEPAVARKKPIDVGKYRLRRGGDDDTVEVVAVELTDYGWAIALDGDAERYLVHKSAAGEYDLLRVEQWRRVAGGVKAVFVPFDDSTRATLTPVRGADSGARYARAKRELARAEDDNATSKRLYEDTADHFVADAIRVGVMAFCVLCMAAALMNLETIKKTFIQNIATRNRRYETLIG